MHGQRNIKKWKMKFNELHVQRGLNRKSLRQYLLIPLKTVGTVHIVKIMERTW